MNKIKQTSLIVAVLLLLNSCAVRSYYQFYDVASTLNNSGNTEDVLKDSNEDCAIDYNFWGEGGNAGFWFYNKTDKNVYIHLDECFFVLNGVAHNYYKDRIYCKTINTGVAGKKTSATQSSTVYYNALFLTTVSTTSSSTNTLFRKEEKVICIPSKTSKYITEYNVTDGVYRDCNLLKYPKRKRIEELSYTLDDSPFVFGNRISYTVGKTGELKSMANDFYVSKIQNRTSKDVTETKYDEFCGEKKLNTRVYLKRGNNNQFYIEYKRKEGDFKH